MTKRSSRHVARVLVTALAVLVLAAPGAAANKLGEVQVDQVRRLVFSPELVIRHQGRIGLTPEQRQQLIGEMQATQTDLVPLQIEISDAGERLAQVLMAARVDEASALELTEQMLGLEARIKRRHMTLLVRIKNLLTEDQQRALFRIRRQAQALAGGAGER